MTSGWVGLVGTYLLGSPPLQAMISYMSRPIRTYCIWNQEFTGITVAKGRVRYGAFCNIYFLSCKASYLWSASSMATKTNINSFQFRCFTASSRYRTPPWRRFVERLDVPEEKSYLSTSATLYPRRVASRAIMDPVLPPPTTMTSNSFLHRLLINYNKGIQFKKLRIYSLLLEAYWTDTFCSLPTYQSAKAHSTIMFSARVENARVAIGKVVAFRITDNISIKQYMVQ